MTILAPLTIPAERYVVVEIVDGVAQAALLHLPLPTHWTRYGARPWDEVAFSDRIEDGFPPLSWPAACGAFSNGSIYVQGGPLRDRPVCDDCLSVVKRARARRRHHQGAHALSSARGLDGLWHVRHRVVDVGLCGARVEVKTGRKWPPTCSACITAGQALDADAPPAWGWGNDVEAAA